MSDDQREIGCAARADLNELCRAGQLRTLRPGQPLSFGDSGLNDAILVVKSGRLKVSRLSPAGKELLLFLLGSGDLLMPPNSPPVRGSESVGEALEESVIAVVRRADFERFLKSRPAAAMTMIEQLVARISVLEERMEELAFKNIGARLSSALLRLAALYGVRGGGSGVILELRLTQEDLAHFIGASREMVNHTLASWKRKGWVESRGRSVILRHPEVLESLAGGEPLPGSG